MHIKAEGHGERKHIANNENAYERHNNRRVVIQLFRNPSVDEQAILPELPPRPRPKKAAPPPQPIAPVIDASAAAPAQEADATAAEPAPADEATQPAAAP